MFGEPFGGEPLRDFRHAVLDVAGAERDQDVGVRLLCGLRYLRQRHDPAGHRDVPCDQLRVHARNRLLACRVDRGEDHLVGQRQRLGKPAVEILRARVEVGLEDGRDAAVGEHVAHRREGGAQLGGVVGIVVHVDHLRRVDVEVEAAAYALERFESLLQFRFVETGRPEQGNGGDAVLDIHDARNAQPAVAQRAVGADDVVAVGAVGLRTQVGGMEVGRRIGAGVGVDADGGVVDRQRHAPFEDQRAARTDLSGKLGEGASQLLVGTVDVEVVGIGRGDDGGVGPQLQERAVELVGLDGQPVAGAIDEVVVEVLGDASEEGAASAAGRVVEPCGEGCRGGLAVRTGNGHDVFVAGEHAEDLGAFQHPETVLAEPAQFGVVVRQGGGVNNERLVRIAECRFDQRRIVRVVDVGALFGEAAGEGGFRAVITGHGGPFEQVVAGDGTHADAADAEKIDMFRIRIHGLLRSVRRGRRGAEFRWPRRGPRRA